MKSVSARNAIRIAIVGDFQIGKSSLVNCLLAESAAEVGEGYFPTTETAGEYPLASGVVLVDTPGFDDTRAALTQRSEVQIESADVVLFVKTDTILGIHDERILRLADRKPKIILFNCWDRTHGRRGWIVDLPENVETCATIQTELERYGMADSILRIEGNLVHSVNVLWAQFGLGLPVSEEQRDGIVAFAQNKLGLKVENAKFRAEMLRRSGFLPVRDFLNNLPLELLKHVVSNPQREIDRIDDPSPAELMERCGFSSLRQRISDLGKPDGISSRLDEAKNRASALYGKAAPTVEKAADAAAAAWRDTIVPNAQVAGEKAKVMAGRAAQSVKDLVSENSRQNLRKTIVSSAAPRMQSCADYIVGKYRATGYDAQVVRIEGGGAEGLLVQIRNATTVGGRFFRTITGLTSCATLKLLPKGSDLEVEVLAGKWLDKIGAAAVSFFVLWPLLVTASIGAFRQKAMLDNLYAEALAWLSNQQ